MTDTGVDRMAVLRDATPVEGDPQRMLPAVAYTSPEVLAWELRHLFAGSWTCLGRLEDLLPETDDKPVTQRAVMVGDVAALVARTQAGMRMFANTCRHRGHELLPDGGTSQRQSIQCPYHAWTYDIGGGLIGAPGFRDEPGFEPAEHGLVELPVRIWQGWVFGHALHRVGEEQVPSFEEHLGDFDGLIAPYDTGALVLADRHTYEVAANWKVIAENYHECYHCPLIHPELCQVSPPESGENYVLPGAFVGGSMDLRDEMATMSMTGELAGTPLPGVDPRKVEYLHLLPNLLVSAHPDYVMAHRLVPLAPGRTWIECSWYVAPGVVSTLRQAQDGASSTNRAVSGAVDFWEITNKQDWAACESVQRGLASPHFSPGPFAPSEDAVAHLVGAIGSAYRLGRLVP
jgi:Rieske 2Fe-2S family protein